MPARELLAEADRAERIHAGMRRLAVVEDGQVDAASSDLDDQGFRRSQGGMVRQARGNGEEGETGFFGPIDDVDVEACAHAHAIEKRVRVGRFAHGARRDRADLADEVAVHDSPEPDQGAHRGIDRDRADPAGREHVLSQQHAARRFFENHGPPTWRDLRHDEPNGRRSDVDDGHGPPRWCRVFARRRLAGRFGCVPVFRHRLVRIRHLVPELIGDRFRRLLKWARMSDPLWTVGPGDVGLRLDKFLAAADRLGSRPRAASALERGKVFVNGDEAGIEAAGRRLADGDVVRVWIDRPGSAKRRRARGVARSADRLRGRCAARAQQAGRPAGRAARTRSDARSVYDEVKSHLRAPPQPASVRRAPHRPRHLRPRGVREARRPRRSGCGISSSGTSRSACISRSCTAIPIRRPGTWRDHLVWDERRSSRRKPIRAIREARKRSATTR